MTLAEFRKIYPVQNPQDIRLERWIVYEKV